MVRSLWTGATGMNAQQLNVDNISNNLANVNTTGYKAEVMEFKSLLYQTIQTKTTTANGENKPIGAEVGLGVSSQDQQTLLLMDKVCLEFRVQMEIHIIQEMVNSYLLLEKKE